MLPQYWTMFSYAAVIIHDDKMKLTRENSHTLSSLTSLF